MNKPHQPPWREFTTDDDAPCTYPEITRPGCEEQTPCARSARIEGIDIRFFRWAFNAPPTRVIRAALSQANLHAPT